MASQDCSQVRCLEIMRSLNNDCFDQKTKQQLLDIKQFLSQTRLFQQLLDEVSFQDILEEAAQKLKYAKYDYGQFLFHYGERGDNIYFILSGSCSVYIPKDEQELAKDVRQLEGSEENESGLASKAKRSKLKKLEAKKYGEQESLQNKNDDISILALNEKHLTRYFTSSTKLASYKHVRDMKYLDYFGDLAAGEHFHRRMASIIASSKQEILEVAYLSLKEYQTIFKSALERIYKVQTSLLNLFMECPRKLVIDFSFLFNQSMVFDRGQTILTESQALNYIYIIKRGSVSIKKLSSTSNQQLMIALLPPKELLGYENIFNKQEKQIICNFSAVSEQARTELSFALLSDVLMFLRCYPLLEELLKKKSQQKMQFYLSRIDQTDKITSNPETMQFLKEAKSPKLLQEEDQQAVFSKFLKYSKNNEGESSQTHSSSSSPKKDKNEEKDQSFTDFSQAEKLRSQLKIENNKRENRIIEDSKSPKAKSNLALNRAKSLINFKQLKINETQTPSIEELKEDFSGIQEDFSQNFQPQTADQLQSDEKLGQSSPQTNLNSFVTFSLNCEHSPILKKTDTPSSSKLNPISLINIQPEQNEKPLDNFPSPFENEAYSQNDSSPKRSFKRQGLMMSQKLKGAIQGMSAVQTQNWTVKEIEKNVQANTEQIKQQDTKEIKLQYLHGEMDSFENAKRFVILKRSTKKQDYLALTSPKSSSLSTTFKVLKQQYSTEKFSNLLKNDQSDNYSQCSPSDSPVHISQLQASFKRHIASSETSSPIQSPTKKSNTQKYFDFNYSPLKNSQKPQFIFPEVHQNKQTQAFVQNSPTHLPQNTLINRQIIPQELSQLSNEITQLQSLPCSSLPISLLLPSTIQNTDNTETDSKSNQDIKMQSINDSLNKNLLTIIGDEPETQNKQKIQLKNIPRHHLFQLSNSPIPTQKQRNLNIFKDNSYSPSKHQINPNSSFQNPLKKNAEISNIETIANQEEKSKLQIGGITLYSTIPKEASQVAIGSFPIKQENGWLNISGKCQQASNVKCSLQTTNPSNNLQCSQNSEQQGFQIKRHSSLQKLTSEKSPSYQKNIKFVLGKEEQNISKAHRKNNSFASFSFNYQEVKSTKPQGDKTSSTISSSSLKNKREVKMNIQNENQTENEKKSNSTNNKLTDNSSNSSNSTFSKFFCSIPASSSFSSQFNLSPSKLSYTPQISNVYSNLNKVTSMPSPSEISVSVSPKNQIRKIVPANNQIPQNQELKSLNNGFLDMHQSNIIKPINMFK